ncbi:hypothetical protein HGRIS_006649 [Hohenbuehelia grisea]|uniref:Protein YAE1 n=1 Tax=Hohenbuehelia grisea TaxID=104357 RepID=A0ABR3J9Z2_9AGAR
MDSPWDDDPHAVSTSDSDWNKMSSEFTNVGYREGITAGKEAALQEGFDDAFANVGAPMGRELGALRGVSSAILSFLSAPASNELSTAIDAQSMLTEARDISAQLGHIRWSDIAPRDLEAEEHARQHLEAEGEAMEGNEALEEKRKLEQVEDMLAGMTSNEGSSSGPARPTIEDVARLRQRLEALNASLGMNLEI